MGLSGSSNLQSQENLFAGGWPRVYAITDPLTNPVEVNLGQVDEAVLRTAREEVQLFTNDFPRRLEVSAPSQVTMSFAGTGRDLTYGLLHLLVGDARIDDSSQYVYPGAGCAFGDIDVTVRGERVNCANEMLVFQIHRARSTGALEIGSGDEFIGTPLELNALDDANGEFGGSPTAPLGWIWLSRP